MMSTILMRRLCASVTPTSRLLSTKVIDGMVTSLTTSPKTKLAPKDLVFGKTFTDHMLEIEWDKEGGWQAPTISPYHNLSLDPAVSSLHYGLQCFEGMKAYIDDDNKIRMFRPDKNMERLKKSAKRLFLPEPSENTLECIQELLRIEKDWIPRGDGFSLYIRPTLISNHPYLGVGPSDKAKFFTILSPVGPYYPEGFSAITLYADHVNVRAWPGGAGDSKIGGNYAPTIKAQMDAAAKGFSQVLWLFGKEAYVTEVGTMNLFFYVKRENGKNALLTAPLDGTILPGVTRACVIDLCKEWDEFELVEEPYTLYEIIEEIKKGNVIEAFGTGTAATICPVKGFHFKGEDYSIPLDPVDPISQTGPLTYRLADTFMHIQYGKIDHPWSVVVKE